MRNFCVGDIHGCYDQLKKTLDLCKFSDSDILYSVGDFCDRGVQNLNTLKFLMSLKNFKPVIGNHDWWLYLWLKVLKKDFNVSMDERDSLNCWINYNGGKNTYNELKSLDENFLNSLFEWLKPIPFMRQVDNKVIIHSIAPEEEIKSRLCNIPLSEITLENIQESNLMVDIVYDSYLWNRQVIKGCKDFYQIGNIFSSYDQYFEETFAKDFTGNPLYIIGHTPLDHAFFDKTHGIIGIDTCVFATKKQYGIDGKLTILDIDNFDYWQSDSLDKKHLEAK